MSNTVNIYLTYSSTTTDEEWLNVFRQKLNMAFLRTITAPINWTVKLFDSEFNPNDIQGQDLFITVLEEQKELDNNYISELESIVNLLNDSNRDYRQLIKILRSPNARINQPEQLINHKGYMFYEPQGRNNRMVPLDFNNSDQNVTAWKLILDLAFDIKLFLQKDNSQEANIIRDGDKFIYLSPCAEDLISLRNEFSRELSNLGITVFPKTNVATDISNFEQTTIEQLDQCNIAIQLLGGRYGEIIKGKGISLLEYENRILTTYTDTHENLTRLIWTNNSLKKIESKQEFFISKLTKQLSGNNKIIHASKDEFKEQLLDYISKTYQISTDVIEPNKVYLVTPNMQEGESLKQQIDDKAIEIVSLTHEKGENSYKKHLQFLSQSDHVLIVWKNHDTLWLNSKISDLIKAPGLGRNKPFKSIGIFTNGITPELTGYLNWLPEITCISENNPEDLHAYLARIKEFENNE